MNETMYEKFENITGYDIKSFFRVLLILYQQNILILSITIKVVV